MINKTILITGSTNGLGKELTKLLALNNNLIMLGRNEELLINLKKELINESSPYKINYYVCDFNSFSDVKRCAQQIIKNNNYIDIIINNAGALLMPNNDLIHPSLKVNFLSPMLLNDLLLDILIKSNDPLIFYTTTMAIPKTISNESLNDMQDLKKIKAYGLAKLAFNLYLKEISENNNVTVKIFDPKIIYTNVIKSVIPKGLKWISPIALLFARRANKVALIALDVLNRQEDEVINYYRLKSKIDYKKAIKINNVSSLIIEKQKQRYL